MATVAYDGTEFAGWQTQPHGRTIQDVLERRLSKMLGATVLIAGSGRTDAGVHARGQVFHFDLPAGGRSRLLAGNETLEAAAARLQRALGGVSENSGLPPSVQVLSVRPAPPRFHAREACLGKRYVYTVDEGAGCPFSVRFRWPLGGRALDLRAMQAAAALLVGEHDFSAFAVRSEGDPRDPTKRMRSLRVARAGGVVSITAECDRYLQHMMRLVSGSLVQVGLGRLSTADIGALLAARSRAGLPEVYRAPAQGLCLERCFYAARPGEAWTLDLPPADAHRSGAPDEPPAQAPPPSGADPDPSAPRHLISDDALDRHRRTRIAN
jgi:tRNA pseudouridine38-40 synthase